MKSTPSITCALLAILILATGCQSCFQRAMVFPLHPINATFARHSSPLKGWKGVRKAANGSCPFHRAVAADYQDYIQKLSEEKRNSVTDVSFFEDGKGGRAVQIGLILDGTGWERVLFYDKNNRRVRVVKYVSNYYVS